jgi:hypothetical protein
MGQWKQQYIESTNWSTSLEDFARLKRMEYLEMDGNAMGMPPSVFANFIRYKYEPKGNPLECEVEAEWELSPSYYHVLKNWRAMHPNLFAEMATYRSRLSFAYGPLRANEIQRQTEKFQEGISSLQGLMAPLEKEREEVFYAWFDALEACKGKLKIGEHTRTFIREHKDSSFVPGRKWPSIEDFELEEALQDNLANIEDMIDNPDAFKLSTGQAKLLDPGQWNDGIRGRNVSLDTLAVIESGRVKDTVPRARLIKYFQGRNMNPYLEDSKFFYKMIVDKSKDIMGVSDLVKCPIHSGAGIYEEVYNAVDGGVYYNFDASGWDGFVPYILDNGAIAIPEGEPKMPSGMDSTSANGSAAHIVWFRALLEANPGLEELVEMIAILSDDGGWCLNANIDPEMITVPGVYGEDAIGSRMKHYLGMSMLDEELWHPVGAKVTVEDPVKGVRLAPFEWSEYLHSDYDVLTRKSVECIYCGTGIDGKPLREIFRDTDLDTLDYIAPNQIRDLLVRQQLENQGAEGEQTSADSGLSLDGETF